MDEKPKLRTCIVNYGSEKRAALFHLFTKEEGNAVVEFGNGECTTVSPWNVQFTDGE
jgi:hypothetical protein